MEKQKTKDISNEDTIDEESASVISDEQKKKDKFINLAEYLPFYHLTDLDVKENFYLLIAIRFFMCIWCSRSFIYPDEFW